MYSPGHVRLKSPSSYTAEQQAERERGSRAKIPNYDTLYEILISFLLPSEHVRAFLFVVSPS